MTRDCWIGPCGRVVPCPPLGHSECAGLICDTILGLEYPYYAMSELEKRGWMKVASPSTGITGFAYGWQVVMHYEFRPTKQSLDSLYGLAVALGGKDADQIHENWNRLSRRAEEMK